MLPYHTILLDVIHSHSLALAISRSAKKMILHAGVVTAYSYNIPSALSIKLHETSYYSVLDAQIKPFLLAQMQICSIAL